MYVDRQVQRALVLHLLRLWLIYLGAAFAFLIVLQPLLSDPGEPLTAYWQQAWGRYLPVVAPLVLLMPVFLSDYVKVTNRFAGPMLRFRRELKALAEGRPAQAIRLRKGDFWHDVSDDFNRVLAIVQPAQSAPASSPGASVVTGADEASVPEAAQTCA